MNRVFQSVVICLIASASVGASIAPAAEKSNSASPESGTSISKNNYNHILNSPGCTHWVVQPETGVFCYTDEEFQALTAGGIEGAPLFAKPPTYPFYDGNDPWKPQPAEEPPPAEEELIDDNYSPEPAAPTISPPPCIKAADGSCVLWTVPR